MTKAKPAHRRILLKLSGEALMGDDAFGINRATIERIVGEIAEVTRMGVQVAVATRLQYPVCNGDDIHIARQREPGYNRRLRRWQHESLGRRIA